MKNKIVIALLCSLTISASTIGSAAIISADPGPGQEMSMPGGPQEIPQGAPGGQGAPNGQNAPDGQNGPMGEMPQGAPDGQSTQDGQNAPMGEMPQGKPEADNDQQAAPDNQRNASDAQNGQQTSPDTQSNQQTSPDTQANQQTQNNRQASQNDMKPASTSQDKQNQKRNKKLQNGQQTAPGTQGEQQSQTDQQAPQNSQQGQMPEGGAPGMAQKENATLGKVTAINGNEVTVSVLKDGKEESVTYDLSNISITKMQGGPIGQNGNIQAPPEKPEGSDNTNGNMQTPPEKPEGSDSTNGNMQTPPEKPEGSDGMNSNVQGETATVSDITEGDMLKVDLDENGSVKSVTLLQNMQNGSNQNGLPGDMQNGSNQNGQPGGMPGGSSQPTEYTASNTLEESSEGASYTSNTDGESAVLVDGRDVSISGTTVAKTGDSNGEDSDFYGTNAAILAVNGGTLSVSDADITTDGAHANAVFSYGEGTTVNISDSTITTTGNNSGGLMTTGGGTMNATNLTVSTSGNSSASIRTDRGGGTVTVDEGSYSTAGVGSPAIYSTADITVSDATLSATNSEAVVIEGGNSVTLNNVNATGNDAALNGQSTVRTNVLIYQSMSGDAAEGNSSFSMTGGSLTSLTGTMFHVTNTTTTIDLSDVEFTYADDSEDFIIISEGSWGKSGSNGGHVTLNLDSQEAEGNAIVDQSSDLVLNLTNGSSYTGAVNSSNSGAEITVSIDSGSTWTLTGDSYITFFDGDISSIITNGYHLYVNGTAIA